MKISAILLFAFAGYIWAFHINPYEPGFLKTPEQAQANLGFCGTSDVGVDGSLGYAEGPSGQRGRTLFMNNCAKCHSPNLQNDLTGPALFGLINRVPSIEWLYEWIPNAPKVIESGDPYAKKLYAEWNQSNMDVMTHLGKEELDDLIYFLTGYGIE